MTFVAVLRPNADDCNKRLSQLTTSSAVVLFNDVTSTSPCVRAGSPWLLKADAGQRFNVTLINFDYPSNVHKSCGKVREMLTGNEVVLTSSRRHQKLMATHGNEIEITFQDGCRVGLEIEGLTT